MPYVAPKPSPSNMIMFRVAATAWLKHLQCRVRRCRRDCRCAGPATTLGLPQCIRDMPFAETSEMLEFFADTIQLATPERVADCMAQAKTDDEREMIAFRRGIFLNYYQELAKAGLAQPLGPPFVEGKITP